jgi:hypothetical protein
MIPSLFAKMIGKVSGNLTKDNKQTFSGLLLSVIVKKDSPTSVPLFCMQIASHKMYFLNYIKTVALPLL